MVEPYGNRQVLNLVYIASYLNFTMQFTVLLLQLSQLYLQLYSTYKMISLLQKKHRLEGRVSRSLKPILDLTPRLESRGHFPSLGYSSCPLESQCNLHVLHCSLCSQFCAPTPHPTRTLKFQSAPQLLLSSSIFQIQYFYIQLEQLQYPHVGVTIKYMQLSDSGPLAIQHCRYLSFVL